MNTAHAAPRDVREVLIVVKETKYGRAVDSSDKRMLALIGDEDPSTRDDMREHREHTKCLRRVKRYFASRAIATTVVSVRDLPKRITQQLVVSVGGDGTFLTAASRCIDAPIIGIRSTGLSLGHFALVNTETFAGVIDEILAGKRLPHSLMRLSVKLRSVVIEGGHVRHRERVIRRPVLNDVLVTNNKCATARYILNVDGTEERQDSSGLWIGTPSGSTAALRSSGGKPLKIEARSIEYVVRELQVRPGVSPKLFRGVIDGAKELSVVSRMPKGKLYLDGEFNEFPFRTGDCVTISRHRHELRAFIDPEVNSRYPYFFGIYAPW